MCNTTKHAKLSEETFRYQEPYGTCVMVYCEVSSRRSGCGLKWAWPSVVLALLPQA